MILDAEVQLVTEKMTRQRVIIHGVRFDLTSATLHKVIQGKETGNLPQFSKYLLTNLRYHALVGFPYKLQTGLTFSTYYEQGQFPLVKSSISLDGNIVHQICRDCFTSYEFAYQITAAHYWLTSQLLKQLPLRENIRLNLIAWLISLLIAILTLPLYLPFLTSITSFGWVMLLLGIWLLRVVIQYLLQWLFPSLQSWLLRQLLFGFLGRWEKGKQVGWRILG